MNTATYNECVRELSDAVYRFALKCTGNADDAQDVVQSGFEVLWLKREEVPADRAKAFLFQVAYNQSVSAYRRSSRHDDETAIPDSGGGQLAPHGLKRALDGALDTLDSRSRALVLLKDYEGYSYAEIGALTGLNESQVKVTLFRARKKLQAYIGKPENVL
jgi:RNA polymerase sigma factor (sigma-70 family)